ncbi:unnamed protein product [Phaedon cochleariae]|uniref:Uncharacterized protein n=1 Tax=Phaedon cochleariae TaxID=80249 RepID=A0A9N9SE88_PHACE|nr:unnamed protein product [Phaedon cochleariae]
MFILSAINLIEGRSLSNNDALSIHQYAKVAKWGANENVTKVQQGRSNSGHALWPHKSDVNFIQTQNSKPTVVKQFPVYIKPQSRQDSVKVDNNPGIGEVIQDRFNARPAFSYTQIPPRNQDSATYGPPKLSTPPAAFPAVFNVAPASASSNKPPVDLYTSPYSSYNPPDIKPETNQDSYPPSIDSYAAPPSDDSYAAPPSHGDGPEQLPPKPTSATLGPPLSPDFGHSHVREVDVYPSDHEDYQMPKNGGDMPPEPPKSIDDVYYPPDFPKDQQQMKAVDMTADLNPPSGPAAFDHHFPHYLYDNHHFDHHVYEEIPHHTTTEATEKRVSSTHYSYYYLGRKLWYIPLYFSIYFMIYVTALILKSIARHKVELKNEWSTSHSRSARQLNLGSLETVDHLHRNITAALDTAHKLYDEIM